MWLSIGLLMNRWLLLCVRWILKCLWLDRLIGCGWSLVVFVNRMFFVLMSDIWISVLFGMMFFLMVFVRLKCVGDFLNLNLMKWVIWLIWWIVLIVCCLSVDDRIVVEVVVFLYVLFFLMDRCVMIMVYSSVSVSILSSGMVNSVCWCDLCGVCSGWFGGVWLDWVEFIEEGGVLFVCVICLDGWLWFGLF